MRSMAEQGFPPPKPPAKEEKPPPVPPELADIFGDAVPPQVLEMYGKLKGKKKRESYVATLAADEEEGKGRQVEEKPFDPHSVASMQTLEEQKQSQEMRRIYARQGLIPPESVREGGVDVSHARAPQYKPNPKMQADMDALYEATPLIPPATETLEAEEQHAIDERIEARHAEPVPVEPAAAEQKTDAEEIRAIRERLGMLEHEAASAANSNRSHDAIEAEAVSLEAELRRVESKGQAAPEAVPLEPEPEEVLPRTLPEEGTHAEHETRLKEVVQKLTAETEAGGLAEKLTPAAPIAERMADGLAERKRELDGALEKKAERLAEKIGEAYNKLSPWTKIVIGGALVVGAAGTAGIAWPLTSLFGGLLATQRAAGMFGMFVNIEKHLQETREGKESKGRVGKFFANREWYQKLAKSSEGGRKNTAAALAMGWTFGMSAAVIYGVKELSQTEFAHAMQDKVRDWLGNLMGHDTSGAPAAPDTHATMPGAAAPAPAAAEMPSVGATGGKGYEYMAKRLWEQLQDKGLEANKFAEGSDIRRLLEAKPDGINKLVHELADKHGFFNANETNVLIRPDARLTINPATGELSFGDAIHGNMVDATEALRAHVTPPFRPEAIAPAAPAPAAEAVGVPTAEAAPLPQVEITTTEPKSGPDLTAEQDLATQKLQEMQEAAAEPSTAASAEATAPVQPTEGYLIDTEGNRVKTESGIEVTTGSYEPPPGANAFGVFVPANEPHIYADTASRLFVYGGSPAERAAKMLEYLNEHTDAIVYGSDRLGNGRIPYYLGPDGELQAEDAVRKSFLGRLFSSDPWMGAPEPEEFAEKIK